MAFGKRGSDQDVMSEINVTPLVDVMLVLLVVFIVTAPLLTQSVKVNLPKTVSASPSPQDHLVTVSIDAKGEVSLNAEKSSLPELGSKLVAMLAKDSELTVQFNADAAVPYGIVAEAMAIAHKSGITHLSFLTREQEAVKPVPEVTSP